MVELKPLDEFFRLGFRESAGAARVISARSLGEMEF